MTVKGYGGTSRRDIVLVTNSLKDEYIDRDPRQLTLIDMLGVVGTGDKVDRQDVGTEQEVPYSSL